MGAPAAPGAGAGSGLPDALVRHIVEGTLHHEAALVFAAELRAVRLKRGVGTRVVADAAGVSRTQVMHYEQGRNVPQVDTAVRLADALDAPKLIEIAKAARVRACRRCNQPVAVGAGRPPDYCSQVCRKAAKPERRAVGKRAMRLMTDERRVMRAAIAAMCAACPDGTDGYCRVKECPLRAVSPLQYRLDRKVAKKAVPR